MRPSIPKRSSTFPTINYDPTDTSQATRQYNSIPTLSITQNGGHCEHSLTPSSSLEAYLADDFQSNSGSRSVSRHPAASQRSLNGLGISHYDERQYVKPEEQDFSFMINPFDDQNGTYVNQLLSEDQFNVHPQNPYSTMERSQSIGANLIGNILASGSFYASSSQMFYGDNQPIAISRSSGEDISVNGSFDTSCSSEGNSLSHSAGSVDVMDTTTPEMVVPYPDINMFDLAYMKHSPQASIDPSFIMMPMPSPISSRSEFPTSIGSSDLFGTSPPHVSPILTARIVDDILSILSNNRERDFSASSASRDDTELPALPEFRDYSPNMQGKRECSIDVQKGSGRRTLKHEEPFEYQVATPTPAAYRSPLVDLRLPSTNQQPMLENIPSSPDSPILNAHLGVHIDELVQKADRYRMRHSGCEIDKKWLLSYAGKLSERGELLDDYRCYVKGCTQVNRRRDHILVHVGSHVDQRPFACSIW